MNISYIIPLIISIFSVAGLILSQIGFLKTINSWVLLLFVSIFLGFSTFLLSKRQLNSPDTFSRSSEQLANTHQHSHNPGFLAILLGLLPLLIIIPGYIAMFLSIRMQLSAHGYYHSGFIHRILNNYIPPENVLFPGTAVNYYWYYHALIASITQTLRVNPLIISTILSLTALIFTIAFMYQIVDLLLIKEKRPWILSILALFALFGMNLFGTIHFLVNSPDITQMFQSHDMFPRPIPLFGDNRLNVALVKYLAIDGTPLGWLFFVFILLLVIQSLTKSVTGKNIFLGLMATFAAFALHTTTGVFVTVAIPTALFITYLLVARANGNLVNRSYHISNLSLGLNAARKHRYWTIAIITLVVVGSIAISLFLLGAISSGTRSVGINLLSKRELLSIISMTYPLIPFFMIAAYQAFKTTDKRLLFLISLTVIGMSMGYVLEFSNNQYKFIYCASIAMCIVCTVPIWNYIFRSDEKRNLVRPLIGTAVIILMAVNVFLLGSANLLSPWVEDDNFIANGIHIESRTAFSGKPFPEVEFEWATDDKGVPYDSDLQYADIFQWVRENTPTDTILIVPVNHRDTSSLLLLSERVPYVIDTFGEKEQPPGFMERIQRVNTIFDRGGPVNYKSIALDEIRQDLHGREKYLLYPSTLSTDVPDIEKNGLLLVYQGRYADLYKFLPDV